MSTEPSTALADFLTERDVPCPACGYNLRGLASGNCPECRQPLVLSVALAEPPLVPFVVSALGLAAAGAAAATLAIVIFVVSVFDGGFPRGDEAVMLLGLPTLIAILHGTAVAALVARGGRRWFRTRSRNARVGIAVASWGASVGTITIWVAVLFRLL